MPGRSPLPRNRWRRALSWLRRAAVLVLLGAVLVLLVGPQPRPEPGPVPPPEPASARSAAGMLASARALAGSAAGGAGVANDTRIARSAAAAAGLLERHARLLGGDPAAAPAGGTESSATASPGAAPSNGTASPGAAPPSSASAGQPDAGRLAGALARSATRLAAEALDTGGERARTLLGIALEQHLAARRLAAAAGAEPPALAPVVGLGWAPLGGLAVACPGADPSPGAGTGPAGDGTAEARAAAALHTAADAAYRAAYAHRVAADRGAAGAAELRDEAAALELLGRRLSGLLEPGCAAVRRPAYALPGGDWAAAARASSGQLAAALRDAAAWAPARARTTLAAEALAAAAASEADTGHIPPLTR